MTSVEKIRNDGTSIYSFPFRVYHLTNDGDQESRFVISVPKRIFRRAVKRNLIRRRIREAWRHIKVSYPGIGPRHFLIVYTSSEILDYDRISEAVKTLLDRIS